MENKTETQGNECFWIQRLFLQNLFTKTQDVPMKPFYDKNKIKESESLPREHRINQLD